MRIERIKARNFKAFEDFDEVFGDVNIMSGRNGQGKSSVLDIVYAAFVAEGDRGLLRTGATEGEFTVVLRDDDGETIEIRRTLKPGSVSAPQVRSSKSGTMGAAATFLKTLVDTATMDPIRRVMSLTPPEQAKILLETIKLDLDHAELTRAVSGLRDVDILPAILQNAKKLPALDALKAVEDLVFKERTLINRDVKTQSAHAQQLRAAVEPEADQNFQAGAAEISKALEAIIAAEGTEKVKILAEVDARDKEIKEACTAALESIQSNAAFRILQIQKEAEAEKEILRHERDTDLKQIARTHSEAREGITNKYATERESLRLKQDQIQQSMIRQATASQTKEAAAKAESQAAASKAKSVEMTNALDEIDKIRGRLLEKLPIPGLKVEGGQIYLKGVPLQEVNTAQQGKFWIGIAARRAVDKGLGTVIIDDAEHFDDLNFPAILQSCKDSGLQFFIGQVAPHPFKIERWSPEEK